MYTNVWLESSAEELEEEEPRQGKAVSYLQLEGGTSGTGALELELAEARKAKGRLEGEVKWLQEELERK